MACLRTACTGSAQPPTGCLPGREAAAGTTTPPALSSSPVRALLVEHQTAIDGSPRGLRTPGATRIARSAPARGEPLGMAGPRSRPRAARAASDGHLPRAPMHRLVFKAQRPPAAARRSARTGSAPARGVTDVLDPFSRLTDLRARSIIARSSDAPGAHLRSVRARRTASVEQVVLRRTADAPDPRPRSPLPRDEADVPAQEAPPRERAWLPGPHEDEGRSSCPRRTARPGASPAQRLTGGRATGPRA